VCIGIVTFSSQADSFILKFEPTWVARTRESAFDTFQTRGPALITLIFSLDLYKWAWLGLSIAHLDFSFPACCTAFAFRHPDHVYGAPDLEERRKPNDH
jgi:hypothetical protein